MGQVSNSSIMAMAVSFVLCTGLPAGLCIYMWKKRHAKINSMMFGVITFIIFALVLEQIFHGLIFQMTGSSLKDNIVIYALYGGLAAGLFEETGRFFAMKVLMKNTLNKDEALMYGVGHGGVEAVLIGALACISNITTAMMYNSGQLSRLLTGEKGAQVQAVVTRLIETPSWQFLLVGVERVSAVILHICLSYLIYQTVKTKKIHWYLAAVFIHMATNAGAVLLAEYTSVLVVELVLLMIAAAFAFFVRKSYGKQGVNKG